MSSGASLNGRMHSAFLRLLLCALPLCGACVARGSRSTTGATGPAQLPGGAVGAWDVRALGARGDGATDDSAAINSALTALPRTNRSIRFPPGVYLVSRTIVIPANVTVTGYGATLKSVNAEPYDPVLKVDHVSGVVIEGFEIDGQRWAVPSLTEFKHGVAVVSSANVTLRDLYSHDNMGDGVYVGAAKGRAPSKNVYVSNIRSEGNARQGVSITALDGGRFEKVVGRGTVGRPPEAGLDIEPGDEASVVRNLSFTDCDFLDNAGAGIMVQFRGTPTAVQSGILFKRCNSSGNRHVGVYLAYPVGVAFEDCAIAANGSWGVDWETGGRDVSFVGSVVRNNAGAGIAILPRTNQEVRNVTIRDSRILDNGQGAKAVGVNIEPVGTGTVSGVTIAAVTVAGSSHSYGLRTGSSRVSNVDIFGSTFSGALVAEVLLCDDVASRRVELSAGVDSAFAHQGCPIRTDR